MTRNDYTLLEAQEAAIVYNQLIDEVQAINIEAAKYLCTDAQEMPNFSCTADLDGVFYWEDSSQGHSYWSAIFRKLQERNSA